MEQHVISKRAMNIINTIAKIVAAVIIIALFLFYFYIQNHNHTYNTGRILSDGWSLSYNGQTIYDDVVLDNVELPEYKKGDLFIYSHAIPPEEDLGNSIMRFKSHHSATEVYVDDNKVYSYGMDILENGGFTGAGQHFVDMRSGPSSGVISIYFYVNDSAGFTRLKPPVIFSKLNALNNLVTDRIIPLYCGVFLIVLSVVLLLLTMFSFVFKDVPTLRIGFLAAFSLIMGLWIFYYSDAVQIFDLPISFTSALENTVFFLVPVPLLYYFMPATENKKTIFGQVYMWFFSAIFCYIIVVFVCHYTNTAHFPVFLKYQHMLMFVSIAFMVCAKLIEAKDNEKRKEAIVSICGLTLVVMGFVFDLVIYYINRYFVALNAENAQFVSLGAVCFVLSIIVSHLMFTNEKIKKSMERDMFRSFAYTDELTQVGNRHFAEELLMQLNEEKKSYTLFSMDLNDLKKTNDTWGHSEGDKMLQS
ncbi:MAG: diguanylate cyclase, partial [Clostridia bacterium]|nr:diguanylate cyclase [Clostridia bacterium]